MIIDMVTTLNTAGRRLIAVVTTAALLCLPVVGQCLGSVAHHTDMATPNTSAIHSIDPSPHAQMDHHHVVDQYHEVSTADMALGDCCDGFTCDMSSCASFVGVHVQVVSLPELLKNATIFTRASVDAAAIHPLVLFKPPIHS